VRQEIHSNMNEISRDSELLVFNGPESKAAGLLIVEAQAEWALASKRQGVLSHITVQVNSRDLQSGK
jgi:hypothetical protein